jgi:Uncharacterized protein conserved in archaea
MKPTKDAGVSPVVGVMLMLVVVIIIAAIVSAFAGGLASTNNKAPQASISGKYSYSSDIFKITHDGGDELSTSKLIIKLQQNDEDFGGYGSLFSQMGSQGTGIIIANKSMICSVDGSSCWVDVTTGGPTIAVFRPGETFIYNETFKKAISGYKDSPIGKSLILEVDTIDGKLISKSKVMIDP